MSRLIDADALIKEIAKIEDLRTLSTKTIGEAIDRVPGIEIIHCKDCKHGAFDAWVKTYWCKGKQHSADWFCADGCLPEIMTPPTGETDEKEKRSKRTSL